MNEILVFAREEAIRVREQEFGDVAPSLADILEGLEEKIDMTQELTEEVKNEITDLIEENVSEIKDNWW